MTHRLLLAGVTLSALLSALAFIGVGIGMANSPPPALDRLGACALPCWNDIIPQETALTDAAQLLSALGYHEGQNDLGSRYRNFQPDAAQLDCRVGLNYRFRVTLMTTLSGCPAVHLGDLILRLGTPERISRTALGLYFRGGTVVVMTRETRCDPWFSPNSEVVAIFLLQAADLRQRTLLTFEPMEQAVPWIGFATPQAYRRFDPDFSICDRARY